VDLVTLRCNSIPRHWRWGYRRTKYYRKTATWLCEHSRSKMSADALQVCVRQTDIPSVV